MFLNVWPLTLTLACLVTKQCLMMFGRQTIIVGPGPYLKIEAVIIKSRPNGFRGMKVWDDEKTKCSRAIFRIFSGIKLQYKLTIKKMKIA